MAAWMRCRTTAWATRGCRDTLNKNDGTFVGESEIIGTPVFHHNRIYVAIGRDPEHGRGRGALHCIDATQTGDITQTGRIWTYQGLDRTLSTVSIADGLLYICDVGGRLHCVDAETGQCYWVHETNSAVWGSTLVADGKVYMPTPKGLIVLAAGKEKRSSARSTSGRRSMPRRSWPTARSTSPPAPAGSGQSARGSGPPRPSHGQGILRVHGPQQTDHQCKGSNAGSRAHRRDAFIASSLSPARTSSHKGPGVLVAASPFEASRFRVVVQACTSRSSVGASRIRRSRHCRDGYGARSPPR